MSNSKGGMGIQSLYRYNIALLGKLCWHLIQNPHTLVARLYKARYFPTSHFMRATSSTDPSFIWSGILTAKNSLAESFRWVLGDGNSIDAVKDP